MAQTVPDAIFEYKTTAEVSFEGVHGAFLSMEFKADFREYGKEGFERREYVIFRCCEEKEIVEPLQKFLEAVFQFLRKDGLEMISRVASALIFFADDLRARNGGGKKKV